jgi:hypothetical protein
MSTAATRIEASALTDPGRRAKAKALVASAGLDPARVSSVQAWPVDRKVTHLLVTMLVPVDRETATAAWAEVLS